MCVYVCIHVYMYVHKASMRTSFVLHDLKISAHTIISCVHLDMTLYNYVMLVNDHEVKYKNIITR